jgi:hypothetical protein
MKARIEPAFEGEGGILREFLERARFAWQGGDSMVKVKSSPKTPPARRTSSDDAMRAGYSGCRRRARWQPIHVGRGRIVAVVSAARMAVTGRQKLWAYGVEDSAVCRPRHVHQRKDARGIDEDKLLAATACLVTLLSACLTLDDEQPDVGLFLSSEWCCWSRPALIRWKSVAH